MRVQSRASLAVRRATTALAGLCIVWLAGCGQKGALTLPAPLAAAPAASTAAR